MFHVLIWGLGALFGEAKSTKALPWQWDCMPVCLKMPSITHVVQYLRGSLCGNFHFAIISNTWLRQSVL